MIEKGNGNRILCFKNLLRTIRGEVPLERLQGLNREFFDAPAGTVTPRLKADISQQIAWYEPRVDVAQIAITDVSPEGDVNFTIEGVE